MHGGTLTEAHKVCNFPSKIEITGLDLSIEMMKHAKENGAKILNDKVSEIKKIENGFKVKTNTEEFKTKKIILASGRKKRLLNVEGEKKFLGKGVSYCAICDGAFYKDKKVAVVGGGNSALTAALLLSEYANKVYIIYRKEKFSKAEPAWISLTDKEDKIEYMFNKEIKKINGKNKVEKIIFKDNEELNVEGVFVEIGFIPNQVLSKQLNLKTEEGYIITDKKQKTNVPGVFAAGDITNNSLKQVITAAAEGAIAATAAHKEIKKGD